MNEFRTLLSKLVRDKKWTQQKLATELGIAQSEVSRIFSGRLALASEAFENLLGKLSAEQATQILQAYLRDKIPSSFAHLVEVNPTGAVCAPPENKGSEPEFPKVMEPKLRRELVFLAQLALSSPDVRKLVALAYKLLAG